MVVEFPWEEDFPSWSTKKKLNTRSSTESEIVGVHDCIPAAFWKRYLTKAQVYQVMGEIVYQDNKIAIILDNNGN